MLRERAAHSGQTRKVAMPDLTTTSLGPPEPTVATEPDPQAIPRPLRGGQHG